MPTINYIVNLVNRVSGQLRDIADQSVKADAAIRNLQDALDKLNRSSTDTAVSTVKLDAALKAVNKNIKDVNGSIRAQLAAARGDAAAMNDLAHATEKVAAAEQAAAMTTREAAAAEADQAAKTARIVAENLAKEQAASNAARASAQKQAAVAAAAAEAEATASKLEQEAAVKAAAAEAAKAAAAEGASKIEIDAAAKTAAAMTAAGFEAKAAEARMGGFVSRLMAINVWIKSNTRGFGLWGGLVGVLTGRLVLFGGLFQRMFGAASPAALILGTISGWHLLADAVLEFVAVVIPAGAAMAAWGVAASDAIREVYHHMQNLHVVSDATDKTIQPMTGHLEALHDAVRPAVFQLFGDALTIMNAKAGIFSKLVMGATRVIEQWGARITIAVAHGRSLDVFLNNAIPDMAKLGDIVGNLFGAFGAIIKEMPGVAEVLLTFVDVLTKIIEKAVQAVGPLIKIALAFHGAWVWAGVFSTALFLLVQALDIVTAAAVKAGFALAAWAIENPIFAGVLALTALIVGLTFALRSARSQAQGFADAVQNKLLKAPISRGMNNFVDAFKLLDAKMAQANQTLSQVPHYLDIIGRGGEKIRITNPVWQQAADAVGVYHKAIQQVSAQSELYQSRLQVLGKRYGGVNAAQGALALSGVTMSQMLSKNAADWLMVQVQVEGTIRGFKAMGQTGTALGNDLQVMDSQVTDQYKAMQQLNQAWDTFTQNLTATQGSFDTVAQGFQALHVQGEKVSASLGKLKDSFTFARRPIDSLLKSGVALNQAFTEQIGNLNTLFDSWRTAGVADNLFTRGVKDAIFPMLKYARGSQEATAQLVGLAQEAGYHGPVSLQRLIKWLGNTHGSLQEVKNVTNQATIQEALLTTAMQGQADFISNELIRDINEAIIAYDGVRQAARDYGNAIAHYGRQSTQAKTAQDILTQSIIRSGQAAHLSTAQIAAMIAKVEKIPLKKAIEIVMRGEGKFSIRQQLLQKGVSPQTIIHGRGPGGQSAAQGGLITRGTGPTSDDVPAMLSRGEYVMKQAAVARYGTHMMDRMNAGRYAGGGPVLQGDKGVLSGQYAVDKYQQFTDRMVTAMETAMKTAFQQAIQLPGNIPGGGSATAALMTVARFLLANGLSRAAAAGIAGTVAGESGGSPFAVGSGGSGLIGWTPSTSAYPYAIYPVVRGRSYAQEMAVQLVDMMAYLLRNGSVADMNRAGLAGPMAAAWHWSAAYERPLVTGSDIRGGSVLSIFRALGGRGMAGGGIIDEPILGFGASGRRYKFGEHGPETVSPGTTGGTQGPLVNIENFYPREEADVAILAQQVNFSITAATMGS